MKYLYIIIVILTVTAGGLELFNLHLSSRLASDSVEVKKVQDKLKSYKEKNEILNSQILELASFDKLASRAAVLGFKESGSYISINPPVEAVALR